MAVVCERDPLKGRGMYKSTSDNLHHQRREGSFSTRASATGKNLLGWDAGTTEQMTPEQERLALIAAQRRGQDLLGRGSLTKAERAEIGQTLLGVALRLGELKEVTRKGARSLLEVHILDVLRERLPYEQWKSAVDEAHKRLARRNQRTTFTNHRT